MGRTQITSAVLALAVGATVAPAADVSWTHDGDGSWGENANWSAAPDWDGSDTLHLDVATLSANRTLTLDGDRAVDTLSVYTTATSAATNRTYIITPGTGGTLQLKNLIVDRNNGSAGFNAFVLSLKDVTTEIVSGGAWTIFDGYIASPSSYVSVKVELGELKSSVDTPLMINYKSRSGGSSSQNNQVLTFAKSNPDLLGGVTFNALQSSSIRMVAEVGASDALGVGQISLTRADGVTGAIEMSIGFTASSDTNHSADIDVGNQMLRLAAANNTTATLSGNLTGTGKLAVRENLNGYYNIGTGTVVFAGANKVSGDIEIGVTNSAGNMQVDGTFTDAGNIVLGKGMLSGNGSIGMASGKTFTTTLHSTQANHHSAIAPGTDGTIGTLTLGTIDNGNTFTFQGASNTQTNIFSLLIDIGGATSDQLVLNGDVDIGAFTNLVFNELSALTAPKYTLVSYTGNLNGTFADTVGLPEGYSLDYSTPGQINLIPEPAALSLLGLGALGLLRRRR